MAVYTFPPVLISPPVGGATSANQVLEIADLDAINANIGAKADAVATTDTGAFSLISLIKKVAQSLTSIYTRQGDGNQLTKITDGGGVVNTRVLSSPIVAADIGLITHSVIHGLSTGGGGSYVDVKVNPSGALTVEATLAASVGTRIGTVAIDQTTPGTTDSVTVKNSFALESTQTTQNTLIGVVTETAPATDTASSGLNGRLQRIAQRLTSLIALFPTTLGQGTMATSLKVVLPSDQSSIPVAATLTAETTKVIGTVNIAASQNVGTNTISGTITSAQKTVGLTEVRATVAGTAPNAARKKLFIKPSKNNTGAIYIGATGLSISTSMEVIGPDRLEFSFDASDYYLISDTAGQVCEILEVI